MTTTVVIALGRTPQMSDLTNPGEVCMVIPVPRGGLAAFMQDPWVAAVLEEGGTVVAEFEASSEADWLEAKLLGRLQ
jgi:hypothetical protein